MTKLYNQKHQTNLRKKLRNNQTSSEKLLWNQLRRRQVNGHRFRRQYSFGKFIVDFFCPELKIAIEVDGANHFFDDRSTDYDLKKQKYINSLGVKVLRFTTTDIYNNIDNVLDVIYETTFLPPPTPPL